MGSGEIAAEPLGRVGCWLAVLDPGQDQAVFGNGEDLGYSRAASLREPAQTFGFADEHGGGCLGPRLDDRVVPVGQSQARRRTDVTASDRGGGDDALAKKSLRP